MKRSLLQHRQLSSEKIKIFRKWRRNIILNRFSKIKLKMKKNQQLKRRILIQKRTKIVIILQLMKWGLQPKIILITLLTPMKKQDQQKMHSPIRNLGISENQKLIRLIEDFKFLRHFMEDRLEMRSLQKEPIWGLHILEKLKKMMFSGMILLVITKLVKLVQMSGE